MGSSDPTPEPICFTVDEEQSGERLDAFLAARLTDFSRVQLRRAISTAGVTVDGQRAKPAYRLKPGQEISVVLPEKVVERPEPEDIPLDILFEDEHLAAINKPPFMVVHPAKGHWAGTLASALTFHFDQLSGTGGATRPGIVHRLDRDTSGVIVVAKSDRAHLALAAQFEARTTEKEYFAIVVGVPDRDRDVIDQPIGPHAHQREKMSVRAGHAKSRDAQTQFEVVERFRGFAVLRILPKTGRTHQIRVHLAYAGYPILCDKLYGGRSRITRGEISGQRDDDKLLLDRQALHAQRLKLRHPETNELLEFVAPLPASLESVRRELREHRSTTQ